MSADARTVIGICSNKPRPMVQSSRSYSLKTGESAWGRDVWHIKGDGMKTLCGRDASEWLIIGETEIDWHCCTRCVSTPRDDRDIGGGL